MNKKLFNDIKTMSKKLEKETGVWWIILYGAYVITFIIYFMWPKNWRNKK